MINYFNSSHVLTLFDNIQEDIVLLSFLNESVNNYQGQEILTVLKEFDNKCIIENKLTNIVWFISPEFQNENVKKLWKDYNSNLTVPYLKFVTKNEIDTNIGCSGMPILTDLFHKRNLL